MIKLICLWVTVLASALTPLSSISGLAHASEDREGSVDASDPLSRQAYMGFQPRPVTPEERSALGLEGPSYAIAKVKPGATMDQAGLKPGDVLKAVNGVAITGGAAMKSALSSVRAGDTLVFDIIRDGQARRLSASGVAVPYDRFDHADVHYDAVAFDGGYLRAILARPKGFDGGPVVYYIQGYACTTVEFRKPGHPTKPFVQQLLDAGIAVWRVEKPGMGDSVNDLACGDSGFRHEVDAFIAGYRHLESLDGIDPQQIYLFGHSMGGYQAPVMVELGVRPAGIAIYGTGLKRWRDYLRDVVRYQDTVMGVGDPLQSAGKLAAMDDAIALLFKGHPSVADVAAQEPEGMKAFGDMFGWDGGDKVLGRHARFMQDVDAYPITRAWSKTGEAGVPVLALAGEVDMAIISPFDTRMIAHIVNRRTPGSAHFAEVPGTNHFMAQIGDHEAMRQLRQSGGYQAVQYNTDPAVAGLVVDWIKGVDQGRRVKSDAAAASL